MSFHLTNIAWDIEQRGHAKLVLLALAHMSTQSDRTCWPTARRLAFMCGLSDSCVRDQIKILQDAGLVERITSPQGAGFRLLIGGCA